MIHAERKTAAFLAEPGEVALASFSLADRVEPVPIFRAAANGCAPLLVAAPETA